MRPRAWVWTAVMAVAAAQTPQRLTLREAEALAVKNHPQVSAALLSALAANQVTTEVRSAYFPAFFGNLTAAGAPEDTRIGAGALNNPAIFSRFGAGVTVSQLITDFGRTGHLTASARLRARAQDQTATATRAEVLLQVDRAYFSALRAQSLLRVAEQTVQARQLVVDQVKALAESKLKSELDLTFAQVNLSEAKLLLLSAQNGLKSAFADLATAMGLPGPQAYDLAEEPLPPALPPDVAPVVQDALQSRPELVSRRLQLESARQFARAERALLLPTLSAVGTTGLIPGRDDTRLRSNYGAVGFNVSIPVFNGRLYSARRQEAELRAQIVEREVQDLENRITRDVQVAWLNAGTAFERMAVTDQLLNQATQALELAQARYDLGLGNIVELGQAQLNKTSAEIARSGATYEYQLQRAVLEYQRGALR